MSGTESEATLRSASESASDVTMAELGDVPTASMLCPLVVLEIGELLLDCFADFGGFFLPFSDAIVPFERDEPLLDISGSNLVYFALFLCFSG